MQTDDMLAEEINLFIETLDGITSTVTSDHIMNLLEEIAGKFPEDKEKMLQIIKKYQDLPDSERTIFQVGRRGGAYRSIDDMKRDPETFKKIKDLLKEIREKDGAPGVEKFIRDMADQYV